MSSTFGGIRNSTGARAQRSGRSTGAVLAFWLVGLVAILVAPAQSVSLLPGWPQTTGSNVISSPALGDLDGDGNLEVVAGSFDGNVYAWHDDGTAVVGWPQSTGGDVESSPALGNLDGTGQLEVVVGSDDGKVYAWHADGTAVAGWPQTTGGDIQSSPALGDLDGDGKLEVLAGSFDGKVYAWNDDGTPVIGWPQVTGSDVISSPALGDLDGDGQLEVVIGSLDGKVYVWDRDGTLAAGWPQATGGNVIGSPALGDLDGDSQLEVVVGSFDGNVYAWHHEGTLLAGWPQDTAIDWGIISSPALGDLDGDSQLEVVVGSLDGNVYAWHHDGSLAAGWPQSTASNVTSSPALGDLDGDGMLEVVIGSLDRNVYAWHHDGTLVDGWPQLTENWVRSSPALGDLDGNGQLEVAIGSDDYNVYVWTTDTTTTDLLPWPMFRNNALRTGLYGQLPVEPGTISGQVKDRGTGAPLVGATVSAYQGEMLVASVTTGAFGVYSISGLAPGSYTAIASDEGYVSQTKAKITVSSGAITYVNFFLNKVVLTGQVRQAGTTTNLAGATVAVYEGDTLMATASTGANGIYQIGGLATGTYTVIASKIGYVRQVKLNVSITEGSVTYVNFNLAVSGRLKGQVKDKVSGEPIIGAIVEARMGGITWATGITTAPWGVYDIAQDLPAGTYLVHASATGYLGQTRKDIVVTAGVTTFVNFFLDKSFSLDKLSLAGQVRQAGTTTNIGDATVAVFDGATLVATATTAANGVYQIGGLTTGTYTVIASKIRFVKQVKLNVSITEGSVTFVNFNLAVSGRIKGQVKDKVSGTPIIGATVVARKDGITWATGTTVAPFGIYDISADLPTGTYVVGASNAGFLGQTRKDIPVTAGVTMFVNFNLQPQ